MLNEKIEALRAFAITAKTAIYNEDAMTAIELAGVTACKVNQCIDAINAMLDIIADLDIVKEQYDAANETIKL